MPKKAKAESITPIHQWTDDNGEVFILRCIGKDGKSYGGFQNPTEIGAVLTVPDVWDKAWGPTPQEWKAGWIPNQECGGGLHGWALLRTPATAVRLRTPATEVRLLVPALGRLLNPCQSAPRHLPPASIPARAPASMVVLRSPGGTNKSSVTKCVAL